MSQLSIKSETKWNYICKNGYIIFFMSWFVNTQQQIKLNGWEYETALSVLKLVWLNLSLALSDSLCRHIRFYVHSFTCCFPHLYLIYSRPSVHAGISLLSLAHESNPWPLNSFEVRKLKKCLFYNDFVLNSTTFSSN